jgi:hypothetical protein
MCLLDCVCWFLRSRTRLLSLSVTTVGGGEKATTRTSEGRIFRVVGGDYLRELSLGRALERRNLL